MSARGHAPWRKASPQNSSGPGWMPSPWPSMIVSSQRGVGPTTQMRAETCGAADRDATAAVPAAGVGRGRWASTSARMLADDPRMATGVRSGVRRPGGRRTGPDVECRQEQALATGTSANNAPSWRTDPGSRSFFATRWACLCDPLSRKPVAVRLRIGRHGRGLSPHGGAGTPGLRHPALLLKRILWTSAVR